MKGTANSAVIVIAAPSGRLTNASYFLAVHRRSRKCNWFLASGRIVYEFLYNNDFERYTLVGSEASTSTSNDFLNEAPLSSIFL